MNRFAELFEDLLAYLKARAAWATQQAETNSQNPDPDVSAPLGGDGGTSNGDGDVQAPLGTG